MNKNLTSVIGAIGASIFFSVLPIYAQPFIYVGSHNPPTPPEPGEEYSWLRKWCLMGWREYGFEHMERCTRLIDKGHVMESYRCGKSCRLYNEQMEPPQQLANGWLRVHVLSTVWLRKFDADKKTWFWANEEFRSRPATSKEFWFAQCDRGLFGSGRTSNLDEIRVRSVYIDSGKYKGLPRRPRVDSTIHDRWHKLCHLPNPSTS